MKTKLFCLICVGLCFDEPSLRAATNIVQIGSYFFTPTNVTIAVGDTVLWTNTVAATQIHDSTSTNIAFQWASGDLNNSKRTFSLTFTNAGSFPYLCSTHVFAFMPSQRHPEQTGTVIVASANLPPSVAITNPPNDAKFLAPANILLQATANDPGGSVTNVQFFSGGGLLGGLGSAPYHFTVSNLAAGNYSFTARAVDNQGAAATSAVVNVFVLTNAILTAPTLLPDGQFRLTVLGIAGQTYATEASTNFQNWSAFATNVAPANTFNVTDATATNVLLRFYRARQDL